MTAGLSGCTSLTGPMGKDRARVIMAVHHLNVTDEKTDSVFPEKTVNNIINHIYK